jgi:Tfp pilus assembly protein PilE
MLIVARRRVAKGVTLVELIAFLVVVSIGAVALLGSYRNILPRAPTPAGITRASLLAQERMELIVGQRTGLGYSSTALDPCPGTQPPCVTVIGFTVSVSGVSSVVGWPSDTAPNRLLNRIITVTVTDSSTNIQLAQQQTILSNY